MKRVFLIFILSFVMCSAHSQSVQGRWETRFQIVNDPLNGIFSASLANSPNDGIVQITFEQELGTVIFCTGKEQQFAWEQHADFISISYLTKKQDIFVAEATPSLVKYDFTDEGMLVLLWERRRSFDDLSEFYLILELFTPTAGPPDS